MRARRGQWAAGRLRGGAARRRTRAWPRLRREEPRVRPPAPPGPRRPLGTRRLCSGGAGTPGAARPPSSFSTTSPWTDGHRAWVLAARSHRRRRRPPRPASRPRRLPLHPEASRGCQPGPRPRACSVPRRRPPASAWTGSARGEWAGLGGAGSTHRLGWPRGLASTPGCDQWAWQPRARVVVSWVLPPSPAAQGTRVRVNHELGRPGHGWGEVGPFTQHTGVVTWDPSATVHGSAQDIGSGSLSAPDAQVRVALRFFILVLKGPSPQHARVQVLVATPALDLGRVDLAASVQSTGDKFG